MRAPAEFRGWIVRDGIQLEPKFPFDFGSGTILHPVSRVLRIEEVAQLPAGELVFLQEGT